MAVFFFFFFQAEDGIRDYKVTGVQTCALPILIVAGSLIRSVHPNASIIGSSSRFDSAANKVSSSTSRTVGLNVAVGKSVSPAIRRTVGRAAICSRSSLGAWSHQTAIDSVSCVPDVATEIAGYSEGSRNG